MDLFNQQSDLSFSAREAMISMDPSLPKLFIVDGMSLLFRSYYAMGRARMTAPDGTPTGAIFGFLKIVFKVLQEQKPTHFAVAWDLPGKTFRHEMFNEYKSNRSATPEDLRPQIKLMHQILPEMGIPSIGVPGYEADDVIGTVAKKFSAEGGQVFIISSDKDFMQLVDERVKLFSLKSGDDYEVLGRNHVVDYFGVPPEGVIDVLALRGDAVDFVPGVKGVGEKSAAKLIGEFGSLDTLYESLDKVTNKRVQSLLDVGRDSAFLSRKLVTIETNVPLHNPDESLQFDMGRLVENPKVREWLDTLRMTSIIRSLYNNLKPNEKMGASASSWPEALKIKEQENPTASQPDQNLFGENIGASAQNAVATTPPTLTAKSWGKRDYSIVKTLEELDAVFARIAAPETTCFSFDTETTGLDIINDKPIGFSVSFEEDTGFYVPVQGMDAPFANNSETVWHKLNEAMQKRTGLAVAHNLKYDAHVLANVGVQLGNAPIACSLIAGWMLNSHIASFGLDAQTMRVLGLQKIPTNQLIGKAAGRSSMLDVPLDIIAEYASEDVDATLRLWNRFYPELKANGLDRIFFDLEMPLLGMLMTMEKNGIHIDNTYLDELSLQLQTRIMEIETRVYEIAGQVFNMSSPKQLGVVMFEHLKVHEKTGYKGKLAKTTLGYKTDANVLDIFSEHEFVKLVIEHRELSKLLGTYVMALPVLINPTTKRIHTSFNQWGTATGRLSSTDPNLQNIPVRTTWGKRVRAAFSAPDDNHVIMSADYSQIELRVLAHLAQDESMLTAFRSGRDIHRETAAKLQNKDPEEVTNEERSAAKAINFGIIYGMGAQRLAREQGVTLNTAKSFIEKYFLNFSKIRDYLDSQKAFGYEHGYVQTHFGRIRKIPGLRSGNPGEARMSENIAINSPIQGTAADIMKMGMLRAREALKTAGVKARILLQVHDELVLECPKNEVEQVSKLVVDSMQNAVNFSVPLVVEVGVGRNWLDAK